MNIVALLFKIIYILIIFPKISYATNVGEDISVAKIVLKIVLYLVLFIVLLIFISYATKIFARSSKKMLKSRYIEIIDTINFGTNGKIIIVKISDYIYILSMTNNNINLIDKLDDSEFEIKKNSEFEGYLNKHMIDSPSNIMEKVQQKVKKIVSSFNRNINDESKEDEDNEEND